MQRRTWCRGAPLASRRCASGQTGRYHACSWQLITFDSAAKTRSPTWPAAGEVSRCMVFCQYTPRESEWRRRTPCPKWNVRGQKSTMTRSCRLTINACRIARSNVMNKLCGRPPQYAPAPCKLTFDLLTLKVVSESRVTWATSVRISVFLGLSVLDLGPMYATDRRQTSDAHHRLMTATPGAWHNKEF